MNLLEIVKQLAAITYRSGKYLVDAIPCILLDGPVGESQTVRIVRAHRALPIRIGQKLMNHDQLQLSAIA